MKFQINHDRDLAREAIRQIKLNDGYCPCALEKNEDTKCMCKDFKDKLAQGYKGECNCGLYETV